MIGIKKSASGTNAPNFVLPRCVREIGKFEQQNALSDMQQNLISNNSCSDATKNKISRYSVHSFLI